MTHEPAEAARPCLVVIPARNEATTVASVVRAARAAVGADVLVVDDASDDGTREEALAAGARVLPLTIRLGAWGAAQTGIRYAHRHGYTRVMTMDGDGQHHADSLPCLLAALDEGHDDIIIGACEQRLSHARRLAWAYFRMLSGLDVRDLTSGLRAYGQHAVAMLASPEASLLEYQDLGVLILAAARGLTLREVQVTMSPRLVGPSRIFSSWPTVARYMLATSVLCLARIGHTGRPRK